MNSRQALISMKGGGVEFIYKPGFIDDTSLELIKMAVDKELSLISNSFYKIAETSGQSKAELKIAYDQAILELATLKQQHEDLVARVVALENATP